MNGKSIAISLGVVFAVGLASYMIYRPVQQPVDDKVGNAVAAVSELLTALPAQIPKSSITAYRPITDELVKSGVMPKVFVAAGVAKNAWGGNVVVQLFPPNAWKPGIPETVNIVIETIPEGDCAALVQRLSQMPPGGIYQINVEPAKRFHTSFPVTSDTGCSSGLNNIGFTAYAK